MADSVKFVSVKNARTQRSDRSATFTRDMFKLDYNEQHQDSVVIKTQGFKLYYSECKRYATLYSCFSLSRVSKECLDVLRFPSDSRLRLFSQLRLTFIRVCTEEENPGSFQTSRCIAVVFWLVVLYYRKGNFQLQHFCVKLFFFFWVMN